MEFSEVVRRRRMIRHYSSRLLAPEIIERVLASALRARIDERRRDTADVVHRGQWGRHS
jgi:hypothetical protein